MTKRFLETALEMRVIDYCDGVERVALVARDIFFRCSASEFVKDGGRDRHIEEGRAKQTSENDYCHGIKNFFSGLPCGKNERNQRESGNGRSHGYRHKPFERT